VARQQRGQLLFHSAFAREFAHRLVALPSLGWHHRPSANSGFDVSGQSLGAVRFKAPHLGEPEA